MILDALFPEILALVTAFEEELHGVLVITLQPKNVVSKISLQSFKQFFFLFFFGNLRNPLDEV